MGIMKLKLFPSCTQHPKTMSFRATTTILKDDEVFKTINSVYFDPDGDSVETPESWFTNSSESASTTTEFHEPFVESHLEEIIRGAQNSANHRLFFEPRGETNSIISDDYHKTHTGKNIQSLIPNTDRHFRGMVFEDLPNLHIDQDVYSLIPDKQRQRKRISSSVSATPQEASVTMSMESEDPYEDFKQSMEEMMESLGVKDDWESLEGLLGWYLKNNDKSNHGYIVGAFLDLLAAIVVANNCNEISKSTTSFSSAASSLSSSASSISAQLLQEDSDHMIS